jgi:hypothetical protein
MDLDLAAIYGDWASRTDVDAAFLLAAFDAPWWIVGGWAIEAFSHHQRPHRDVDIAIHASSLTSLRGLLQDEWHIWANTSGSLQYLAPGRPLPNGCDQLWLRQDARHPWEYDVLLHAGPVDRWVSRRNPHLSMELTAATWIGDNGVRYQNPEITLLFKARSLNHQDEVDFAHTWSHLTRRQQCWLRDELRRENLRHPWLAQGGEDTAR